MRVILPGSYDPVTVGHLEVIKRAARNEDEVFVVVFQNPNKKYRFSLEDRVAMLMLAAEEYDNVLVSYSDGFVVDYMREHNIQKIIKGYRTEADLPWEYEQAEYNRKHGGYETELVKCAPEYEHISSTAVRAALDRGEVPRDLLPEAVARYIENLK